jgi:hypothetical protein
MTMHTFIAAIILATTPTAPAWLPGDWEPYSNAFIGLRMLSVGKDTLSWKGCTDAHFEVVDANGDTVVLRLAKNTTCELNDAPPTRMDTLRLTLRPNRCDLGVEVFASPAAMSRNEPSATGLYGKSKCPSGPVDQAAASFSTTPR